MPGVPKFRGCDACLIRKKKCEQASPPCPRCVRLKIPCTGMGKLRYKFRDPFTPRRQRDSMAKEQLGSQQTVSASSTTPVSALSLPENKQVEAHVEHGLASALVVATSAAHGTQPPGSPRTLRESPYSIWPDDETRHLQFFMEKTVTQFVIFFPDSDWRNLILRMAHAERSIRYALMSLASSHEWHLDPTNREHRGRESPISLHHMSLALGYLQQDQMSTCDSIHLSLCTCLLFMCIEGLNDRTASAMRLFKRGRTMIKEHRNRRSVSKGKQPELPPEVETMISSVQHIFCRLEVQLAPVIGGLDPDFMFGPDSDFTTLQWPMQSSFTSLVHARDVLLHAHVCAIVDGLKGQVAGHVHDTYIATWSSAFDSFLREQYQRFEDDIESFNRTTALLELMKRHVGITLLWGGETKEETYTEMLQYAKQSLGAGVDVDQQHEARNKTNTDEEEERTATKTEAAEECGFHFDLGIVPALFSIFMGSGSHDTRRQVAGIFRRARLLKSIWCGRIVGRVLDRIMELEEGTHCDGTRHYASRGGRIRSAQIHYDNDSTGEDAVIQFGSVNHVFFEAMPA